MGGIRLPQVLTFMVSVGLSTAQTGSKPYFVDQASFPKIVYWNETADATYGTPGGTTLFTFYAVDGENTVPILNFSYDPSTTLDYIEKEETTVGLQRKAEFKLKLYEVFDYETANTFTIYAQAFDGVYYSDKVFIKLQILNIPEAPYTNPATTVQHFTIQENSAGTVIGNPSFSVLDGDTAETITWSITGGTGQNFIAINSNNGTIILKADYDRDKPSYAETVYLNIEIKDSDDLSATVTFSVTFTDRNDLDPICNPAKYEFNVTSDMGAGDFLTSISCYDNDITSPNNELTFEFQSSDPNSEYFTVTNTTNNQGQVEVKYHIDLEYGSGPYTIFLLAIDGGTPARTGTATLIFGLPEATTLPPTTTNLPNPAYDALSSDTSLTALLIVAAFGAACILGYVLILCWRWHTFGKCLPDQCPDRSDFRKCCTCCPGDDIERDQILVSSGMQNGYFNQINEKKGMSLGPEAPNSRRKTPSRSFFS